MSGGWMSASRARTWWTAGTAGLPPASRFRFDADRTSFLGAHALARRLLQAATGIAAASLTFSVGPRGKPELSVHGPMPIRFNLSHTRGMVTVAVGLCHDLGVDVEALDRMLPDLDLAQRYFAASEVQQLRESPAADRARCFFRFWTLKEPISRRPAKGCCARSTASPSR
jgi:4'-phosphopantetheinyl transferase